MFCVLLCGAAGSDSGAGTKVWLCRADGGSREDEVKGVCYVRVTKAAAQSAVLIVFLISSA